MIICSFSDAGSIEQCILWSSTVKWHYSNFMMFSYSQFCKCNPVASENKPPPYSCQASKGAFYSSIPSINILCSNVRQPSLCSTEGQSKGVSVQELDTNIQYLGPDWIVGWGTWCMLWLGCIWTSREGQVDRYERKVLEDFIHDITYVAMVCRTLLAKRTGSFLSSSVGT